MYYYERKPTQRTAKVAVIVVMLIIVIILATIIVHRPSSYTYVQTPHVTETLQLPQPYVKLSVEAHEAEGHWTRDSNDLPCYKSTIVYTVSNGGTAYANNVNVMVTLNARPFRSFDISLPSQSHETDSIQFAFEYDTSNTVLIKASSSNSEDEITLTINAKSPPANLFITPNDPVIKSTLNIILQSYPLIPKWVAIRDWVANNIKYNYTALELGIVYQLPRETLQHGQGVCFDYSVLLVTLYRSAGYSADKVFVVAGKNEQNQYHAWVRLYVDGIGWQNIEPQANMLATFVGDYLVLSGFTAMFYFNDVYLHSV